MADIYKSEAGRQVVEALYRGALQRWPVPSRQVIVPTCQGDTFVIVSGDHRAAPLVLFHGSGSNSCAWIRDVAEWSRSHAVYAVDMIGEPGLSAPSRPPLRSDAYVQWLDEVWNGLGLTRAHVAGMSLGGWLAVTYASKRPDRVASLSLVSPSGIGAQNRLFLVKAGLFLACGEWGLRKALKLAAGNAGVPREVNDFLVSVFRHFRPRMERLPLSSDEQLAALTMPVQLILGGKDRLLRSAETRNRMTRLVPDLHVTYLENAGHFLPRQTQAIASFIRRTPPPCHRHNRRAERSILLHDFQGGRVPPYGT